MTAWTNAADPIRVYYRRSWFDPWTLTGTVSVGEMKDGSGNQVGSCPLTSWLPRGSAREEGAQACPLKVGDFVRVVQMPTGGDSAQVWDLLWSGVVLERAEENSGEHTRETWTCGGIGSLFGQIDLSRSWGGSSESIAMLQGDLAFSPGKVDNQVDDDFRFLTNFGSKGRPWTARQVLLALLEWHLYTTDAEGNKAKRYPRWPDFTLTGFGGDEAKLDGALGFKVRDLSARGTLLDALVNILHPRRGLSFIVEPPASALSSNSDPCAIRVLSLLSSPMTVTIPDSEGGGSITVPASDLSTGVDASAPSRRAFASGDSIPRRLSLLGKGAVAILNLRWSRDAGGAETGQLTRGWPVADDGQSGFDIKYNDVYRTWHLRPGWDGVLTNGATSDRLARKLVVAGSSGEPDPLFGAEGLTGVRIGTSGPSFAALNARILDQIPMPSAAKDADGNPVKITDWLSSPLGKSLDWTKPKIRPRVLIHERSGNTWRELKVSISITGPTTIQLGDSQQDRARIRSALQSPTADLVVVCALVEPLPFMVSYEPPTPAATDPGIGADRVRRCPWAEYVWIPAGTVLDLPTGGTPLTVGTATVVRDDSALLRQCLALARPLGERPASITVEDRLQLGGAANLDGYGNTAPLPKAGTLVTGLVPAVGRYLPVNYVVASRTRSARPGSYGTRIVCELPQTDVEAML